MAVDLDRPWKLTRHETHHRAADGASVGIHLRPHSHACIAFHLAMSARYRERARRGDAPTYCAHMGRSWVKTARAERLSATDTFRPRLP